MDRPLPPEIERRNRLRRIARIAGPIVVIDAVLAALPGWIRPTVTRSRIRTANVIAGPVEAVITAGGTVVPDVERVLSSPLDARVLRILQRPGAQLHQGDPVVELDISESVLALDKCRQGPEDQGEPAGAEPAHAREVARRSRGVLTWVLSQEGAPV